jgi:hypothetical protein
VGQHRADLAPVGLFDLDPHGSLKEPEAISHTLF